MLAQKRANLKGEVEHAAALVDAERCMAAKAVAEEELEQAAPALNHAVLLLNALRASDVAEVRALKHPPQSVKLVLEAVCLLFGVGPTCTYDATVVPPPLGRGGERVRREIWRPALSLMHGPLNKVLEKWGNFDKDNVDPRVLAKLRYSGRYVGSMDFTLEKVQNCSLAAANVLRWVKGVLLWDQIMTTLRPKMKAVAAARRELDGSLGMLKDAKQVAETNKMVTYLKMG